MRAEQEHVTRRALDRPVLVDGAHHGLVRLSQHAVIPELGYRPAGGQRRHPGAAPATQLAANLIAVQVGCAAAAAGSDAFGQQLGDVVEIGIGHRRERCRAPDQRQKLGFLPFHCGALGDDLLGQDVQRAAAG